MQPQFLEIPNHFQSKQKVFAYGLHMNLKINGVDKFAKVVQRFAFNTTF